MSLPSGDYAFTARELIIGNGGTLDIGDASLSIQYGTQSDPVASIAALLSSGLAGGTWNGDGIISTTAANDTSQTTSVGYYDDGTQVTIRRSWFGDANLDGQINADDLSLVELGQIQNGTRWQDGNFNYDNQVNADDWIKLMYALAVSNGQPLSLGTSNPTIQNSQTLVSDSAVATKPLAQTFAQTPISLDNDFSDLLETPQGML